MSLLWRPLQQIASWLDECPQVRVEHVPPAAKREQIKGQRNPLELEVRFLSTRPFFRQHFSGCIRQVLGIWTEDWSLVESFPLNSLLKAFLVCNILSLLGLPCFIRYTNPRYTQMLNCGKGREMKELMRNTETEGCDHADHTETQLCRCSHSKNANSWLGLDWPEYDIYHVV